MNVNKQRFETAIFAVADALERPGKYMAFVFSGPQNIEPQEIERSRGQVKEVASTLRQIVTEGRSESITRGEIEALFERVKQLGGHVPDKEASELWRALHAYRPDAPY